jgi:hypothetical protein
VLAFSDQLGGVLSMSFSPSIVPDGADQDIYLVLNQFGERLGRAWCETDLPLGRPGRE